MNQNWMKLQLKWKPKDGPKKHDVSLLQKTQFVLHACRVQCWGLAALLEEGIPPRGTIVEIVCLCQASKGTQS